MGYAVAVGMEVRDADGKRLGKVSRLDPWGFEVVRRLWSPYEWVIRWDEVLEVDGAGVRVARSDTALYELAEGKIPRAWTTIRPPEADAPLPATPAEASPEGALERTPRARG